MEIIDEDIVEGKYHTVTICIQDVMNSQDMKNICGNLKITSATKMYPLLKFLINKISQ